MRAYLPTEVIFNLISLWPLALIVLYNTSRLFYAAIYSTVTLVILIVMLSIFQKLSCTCAALIFLLEVKTFSIIN